MRVLVPEKTPEVFKSYVLYQIRRFPRMHSPRCTVCLNTEVCKSIAGLTEQTREGKKKVFPR